MTFRYCLALVALAFLIPQIASAKTDTLSHWSPYPKPSLDVHRLDGKITIDGNLDDDGWKSAAHVMDFTECLPAPNAEPHQKTEAYIAYDDDAIYIAMIAHDDHPEAIRASLRNRDDIWNEDFMGIILDTYGDATRACEIYCNPKGIQGDLLWTTTNEDQSYDMLYKSEAKITPDGWQMEMRIPFSSLRFPPKDVQNWKMTFWRNHPRTSDYKYSWSPVNFYEPCTFCQFGSLTGIEHIHSGGNLELMPSLTAEQSALPDAISGKLVNNPVTVKPSLEARYFAGADGAIEATINPDFSQIEADASQVDANTTFALFYPERRPFFQEGNDLYTMNLNAVYTRSINDPLAAAKGILRGAHSSLEFTSAYDRNSPVLIPLEERSVLTNGGKSLSNIVRATRTLGDDTYIGGLLTDRRYENNGANTVAGIDGRVWLFENVEAYGQFLYSQTREPDSSVNSYVDTTEFGNGHDLTFNSESFSGTALYAALDRYTSGLDFHTVYEQLSPAFRSGNGFMTQNDFRTTESVLDYKFMFKESPIVKITPMVILAENWNFNNDVKFRGYRAACDIALQGQTSVHAHYRHYLERFHNVDFPSMQQWDLSPSTNFNQYVALGFDLTLGDEIARYLDVPQKGRYTNLYAWGELKPFGGFLIVPNYTYSRLDSNNGTFFEGSIYRTRFGYQFTRELDVRLVAEYNTFTQQIALDPLLTYKLNPFSSLYIGSTHNLQDVSQNNTFQPVSRQFFAKIQYLMAG